MYTVYVFEKEPKGCVTIAEAKREADTIEVDTVENALIYLHAHRLKNNPEFACADIGDFRTLIGNLKLPVTCCDNDKVMSLVKQLNDEEKQLCAPDIEITPTEREGVSRVVSTAMNFDSVAWNDELHTVVEGLVNEYNDLMEAGELTC